MRAFFRFGAMVLLAGLLAFATRPASAQMMHYNLVVTLNLTSSQLLTGGQVCVSGEVDDSCQDIAPGTGTGARYTFNGLGAGDHTVTVSGDPYLETVEYVTLEDESTYIEISLQMEQLPGLPNTGSGVSRGAFSNDSLFGAAAVLALAGVGLVMRRHGLDFDR